MTNETLKFGINRENHSRIFYETYEAKTRYVINYGGSASGKSYSQAQAEIYRILTGEHDTIVFRKVGADLYDSCFKLMKAILNHTNIPEKTPIEYVYSGQMREIRFREFGRKISFRGLDDPDKVKSLHGYKRIWIEEADKITRDDFTELMRRFRGMEDIQLTMTFNPISEFHWIKKLFFDEPNFKHLTTYIHSTYLDNRWLTNSDREAIEMLKDIDYNQYRVYGLGEWGQVQVARPFATSFKIQKHVVENLSINYKLPVWLSFDFNIDPCTCLVCQMDAQERLKIIKEYRVSNADIYQLCHVINTDFAGKNAFFRITGDPSGRAGSAMVQGNVNYYKIICRELRISEQSLKVMLAHLSHKNSRALFNYVLSQLDVQIDASCRYLIEDLLYVEVDEDGKIEKSKDKHRSHLLDCFRYMIDLNYQKYLNTKILKTITK